MADPLETVIGLDLSRYAGRWYEIASMPSRFQPKTGTNSRATYTLQEDGTIGVVNETWVDGKRAFIEGKAWKRDTQSDHAAFFVRFWVPPFLPVWPVTGDYWVMDLDKEKYSYALVGQPSRTYLWVLSRTPQMDEQKYEELLAKAREQGYDTSKLKKTEHPGGVEEAAKDTDRGGWWLGALFGKK